MEDGSFLRGERAGTAGVVTLVLVLGAARSPGSGMVMAYALPSDGVRAAVSAVAEASGEATAAVTTAELSDEKDISSRLRSIVEAGPAGAVLVSLATLELARSQLDADYRFEDLITVDVPSLGKERVFLVEHPSLPPPTTTPMRTEMEHRDGFMGRERELEEIARRLDRARIVTVVGASGIGKSAIIRRFVSSNSEQFPDGVIEVDLSSVSQSAVVVPMMLRLCGAVRLPGESVFDALVAQLRARRALLVIDNAEGVLSEVRRIVSALVRGAPNVAILVGSQRAMRLPGEARVKVEGLEAPVGVEDWRSFENYEAVALFLDRAQLVDSRFELKRETALTVVKICQKLDGIPLAIEMAASKVSILSPRQILDRLDDRLHFTDNTVVRADRHRTLRAMIDWGHDQLRPEARILLRRLAPFAGAFTIDEAVAVASDDKLPPDAVEVAFDELAEASLLTPSTVGGEEKRLYLMETVRLYAKERLKKADEERTFAARHRAWCLDLARRGQPGLTGKDQLEWLNRIDAAYEDLRQAIEGETLPRGDLGKAMELLIAINPYFIHRTYHGEGLRLCEKVLDAPQAAKKAPYARLLNLAAVLSMRLGETRNAHGYAIRSHWTARRKNDSLVWAISRSTLAMIAEEQGRALRARRHHLAAVKSYRAQGLAVRLLTELVNVLSVEADLGMAEANDHLHEARALLDKHPNPLLEAYLYLNWSHFEIRKHNPQRALETTRQAAEHFVAARSQGAICSCWRNAAYAFEQLGMLSVAAFFIGAARRATQGAEVRPQSKYEEGWRTLTQRVQEALGDRFDDWEFDGYTSTDKEVLERIEYESRK
ncbi:MAG: ATP-binding protein [Fimbriimonas sp.]